MHSHFIQNNFQSICGPFSSDLNQYKAVLVVPDIYNRGHLRELMTLLLIKMGFGSCFLVQVRRFRAILFTLFKMNADCNRIMWQLRSVLDWDMHVSSMSAIRRRQCRA